MSGTERSQNPVVEAKPHGDAGPDLSSRALELRLRQQQILSELGVAALKGASIDQMLDDATRLAAEGLRTEFSKVLEYLPDEACFIVRAGVGWGPDVVGVAKVGADLASPAGFALKTGQPVISNHLGREQRFRTPELLARHGISRAMNVILQGDGTPFGVLEVDSLSEHDFSERDIAFLQGVANILGMGIEKERFQRNLTSALERHQVLLKEMNHRVKNSLSIVSSVLRLQARDHRASPTGVALEAASLRVQAVARAHERLYLASEVERLDIGRYIEQICSDIDASLTLCDIHVDAQQGIMVSTDRAISLALMVNELITNAAKHAYDETASFNVWVAVKAHTGMIDVTVRDAGNGLPAGFDLTQAKGLGMRIIAAFVSQLKATVAYKRLAPGTEFVVSLPIVDTA